MDYEEDLNAPVWDELNESNRSPTVEISDAFDALSTTDGKQEVEETNKTASTQLWHPEEDGDDTGASGLLDSLAPKDVDLVSDLRQEDENNMAIGEDQPLFGASTYLPVVEVVEDKGDAKSNKSSGKPTVLFSTPRLRRRPIQQKSSTLQDDPLRQAKAESKFVEESLDEVQQEKSKQTPKKPLNILEQVDKPLFKLSPKKIDVELGVEEAVADATPVPELSTNDLIPFEIEVKDPIKVGELTALHVEYTVVAKSDLLESTNYSQVNRRYSDFRWLYRQLQSNHWGLIIPPPPEKQSMGRFNQDFIENRRFQMERMLLHIANDPVLQKDSDFLLFLSSPNFFADSKTREQYTGSKASNDHNDLSEVHISEIELLGAEDAAIVMKNGGLDGEQNRGFMSLSFSSLPKYTEEDEYFITERESMDLLEDQLKELYKSLELVSSERAELASVVDEFSATVDRLAKLEVTKKTSMLLTSFAQVHRRVKESLDRISMQEEMTLGVVLDEYIRSIASVKATFNQRAKLGYYLVVVRGDLNKAKVSLEKAKASAGTRSNVDKMTSLKQTYELLLKRYNTIKKRWDSVGHTIKNEVEKFGVSKVNEFRNNMEIFLESVIESTKESIELWETFYQGNL